MKIGDRYYCIFPRYGGSREINIAGKEYTIINIDGTHVYLTNEQHSPIYFYTTYDYGSITCHFYRHFLTEQQYRKQKLEKIYENR